MFQQPLLFCVRCGSLGYMASLYDQNFGCSIHANQLINLNRSEHFVTPQCDHRTRPSLHHHHHQDEDSTSTVEANRDQFQVVINVQQYKPEEIKVKVVDNFMEIEAWQEEKQDEHGWVSRHLARRYVVPEQYDIDQMSSNLSPDGMLSVIVPRKDRQNERRSVRIELSSRR